MDSLSIEDRLAIHDVINLHGHLVDGGEFDRLGDVLVEDCAYDLTAFGAGVLNGLDAVRAASVALGEGNPVGHHVTNILITGAGHDETGDWARAVSKGIGINANGTAGSVLYRDLLRRNDSGWRVTERAVVPRRRPLHP